MSDNDLHSVDGHDAFLEKSIQRTERLRKRLNNFNPDEVIKKKKEETRNATRTVHEQTDLTSDIILGEYARDIALNEDNFVVRFLKNIFSWAITLVIAQILVFITWLVYYGKFSIEFFNMKNFEFLKNMFISGINPKGSFLSKVEFTSFMFMETGFIVFAVLSLIYFIFRRK